MLSSAEQPRRIPVLSAEAAKPRRYILLCGESQKADSSGFTLASLLRHTQGIFVGTSLLTCAFLTSSGFIPDISSIIKKACNSNGMTEISLDDQSRSIGKNGTTVILRDKDYKYLHLPVIELKPEREPLNPMIPLPSNLTSAHISVDIYRGPISAVTAEGPVGGPGVQNPDSSLLITRNQLPNC